MIVDLEKYNKDPLDLVERHKEIVAYLRANGIDGRVIKAILEDRHGFQATIEIPMPNTNISAWDREQTQIAYARRHVTSLINSRAITDEEKEFLFKIDRRLSEEYFPVDTDKAGRHIFRLPPAECKNAKAKTERQMTGFRVVLLYDYIDGYNTNYLQIHIFDLIAELLGVYGGEKFSRSEVANFYKNNLKFL